jgi:Cdc6-like AAA superfamily ATPase
MQERQLQELQKQEQERQQRKLKKKQQKQEQEKQKQDQHKQEHQQPQQEQQQQIEQQRNQQAQQQKQQIEQQQHTQQKIEQEKKLMEQQQKQQLIERQQQQQINQEEKQQAQKQKQLMEQQQQQQQQQKRPREQEQNQQIRPDQEFLPIHESSNSPQKHQSTKMNKENLFSTIISDKEQQQQQNCKPPPKKRQHVQTSNRDDDDSSENSSSSLLTQADKQESESDCHSRDHSVSVAIANDESLCQSPLPHPFMNDDGDDDDEDDDDNNASSTTQIQSLTTPKRSGTTGNIKQAHIDHDSDESQASPIKEQFSYMQKRNNNMKRNHQRFLDLGIMKKPPTPRVVIAKDDDSSEHSVIDEDDRSLATGMMFATRSNGLWNECDLDEHMNMDSNCRDEISPSAQDIFTDFPHRRKQIFLLQSCLGNSVRQMEIPIEKDECGSALNTYSPPPIFVTGPSGTGKTSVVRRILRDLKQESLKGINGNNACNSNAKNGRKEMGKRPIGVAYINCSTMEPYGTGPSSILESTYTQLANQMAIDRGTDDGKRVRMRTNKFNRLHIGSSDSLDNDEVSNSCSDSFGGVETDEDSLAYNSTGVDSLSIGEDTDDDNTDLSDIDDEDMIENCATNERSGFIKAAARPKPAQQKETPRLPQDAPRRSSRLGNPSQALTSVNQGSTTHRSAKKKSSGLMGILSTPASFGRSITQFCGVSEYNSFQRGCAFLVLDHADMLLSFSHNKQKKNLHTNFLSELLLLPQIMSLNLTIIVITDKLMLENTSEFMLKCIRTLCSKWISYLITIH